MDRLTARQREIVLLRCRNDLSVKAVARALHIAPGTVKNHCTMAMRRLDTISIARTCYLVGQAYAVDATRTDQV